MKPKTESKLPNYRIYDRTGGGVTHDIYAESLEDAIEQGCEWIEDGDWSGDREGDRRGERQYEIGQPLDCSVGEIVRDEDGEIDVTATREHCSDNDCSGEYSDTLPYCEQREHVGDDDSADDEGHVWRAPFSVVGGMKENPGVWGGCGTNMSSHEVCRLCGCHKHTHSAGSQRNPGEPRETITIKDRDEDSAAWLKRTHAEDGFIPAWLAEMLGCSISLRMTKEEADEWVAAHSDEDDLDEDELEHAYAATFGVRADDQDRAEGLWSHLNA